MTMTASAQRAAAEWVLCPNCRNILYTRRLERELHVCHWCGSHHRLSARARIAQLFDGGAAEEIGITEHSTDVLGFADTETYPERLAKARRRTGLDEGAVAAAGAVLGRPAVAAVMDFAFMGGSLGAAIGGVVSRAADVCLQRRLPLVLVCTSGGARMQEGVLALMQMARTTQAMADLDEAGLLTVCLITDPTYGGVAASFATLGDVVVCEPGARLGFAGPRVIEQTIRETLPEGFQTAEFLLEHGLIDMIRPRAALRGTLARLLDAGASGSAPRRATARTDPAIREPEALSRADAWDVVQRARSLERPTTLDYADMVFDDFAELRGDRIGHDCGAVVGGLARLDGAPLVVIGHQKGHTVAELAARNYGMAAPDGYRKAARLMRLAGKLGLPVVTLIDTPGAYPGVEAESRGQAVAIAESIQTMAGLPVPVVALVTGEGGSGGALALGVGDEVLICANATYSVISPEGCASILWSDRTMAPAAAAALGITPRELLRLGVVDGVVPEPAGGSQADPEAAAESIRGAVSASLTRLAGRSTAGLKASRRARYRGFGAAHAAGAGTTPVEVQQ
ncbi:acetyl-CoA carboxylase carboxyl transferase subunit alpha [Streptomonospora wellingtoniae]|uniref:Multifunctional fusion protein n=1 Tax=Streptomonospora wellingtoniae TaxID=3075544 RepID=A0ABU2KX98_9ACTN|nr:acetyl-CoA carboxylase carboxyl transferase subunit alpha [Streptomonospora sp. DSM 45055]MDT0303931.1 acetyl-CoA carboxylase carboxyl transferase subunit alpha [Streptomonospora sp. DSM 45055]